MNRIDYFFSPLSPYAYLAGDGLEEIAARHGAAITYRPFDLLSVFSRTGGVPVSERHPSRQAYRLADLARSARLAGLTLNPRPMHVGANPAPAAYAIIAAQAAGGGDTGALVRALLAAVWAQERDIGDDSVIRACLEGAGFPASLADSGLLAGAEAYGRNTEEAVLRGVFGAPSYLAGEALFWGQDRLAHLDAHLAGRL